MKPKPNIQLEKGKKSIKRETVVVVLGFYFSAIRERMSVRSFKIFLNIYFVHK